MWREPFSTHCIKFDVIDHIDDSYQDPTPKPNDLELKKMDSILKLYIRVNLSGSPSNGAEERLDYS